MLSSLKATEGGDASASDLSQTLVGRRNNLKAIRAKSKSLNEDYWRLRMSCVSEIARLEPDLIPLVNPSGRVEVQSLTMDPGTIEKVEAFCASENVTSFDFWISVWQVLISRICLKNEVLVGTPHTRNGKEALEKGKAKDCIVPILAIVNEGESFRRFCKRVHKSVIEDFAHSLMEYGEILGLTAIDTGLQEIHSPHFMFEVSGHDNTRANGSESDAPMTDQKQVGEMPITLGISMSQHAITAHLCYSHDRYGSQTMRPLLERLEQMAHQVLLDARTRIGEIDILLGGEKDRIMELAGRDNVVDYPKTTLNAIFRDTARRHPERTAVVEADGHETTYAELQAQVAGIAAFLRGKGVGRDTVVAVHLPRTASLLASILGILEAGGAFLLLEPSLPIDRLGRICEESRAQFLLTEQGMALIPGFSGRSSHVNDIIFAGSIENESVPSTYDPSSIAYVIFTSGSTGVPKGAMVEHGNIINRLCHTRDAMDFGIEDRTLQKSALSFDVCITELLMPMFTGAAVVMADALGVIDMERLAELIARHRATYVHFVPAALKNFLEVPDIAKVNGILRMIRCGGESLSLKTMRECMSTLDAQLYQSYGPAETAVAVTIWRCHDLINDIKPPIGRPNANVDVMIMDPAGRPVPPGMKGEIWIGGAQTGRGYINNAEETRTRFVKDPLTTDSGRRYYRTGDLGRFLLDGNLLFLGRMDDQVKVRGVRIELGEVTASLLRCEAVKEAVVLAEDDGMGSKRLRAWVTIEEGSSIAESTIKSELIRLLPDYMLPFRIHVIDAMPLTPHGKTDHRSLRRLSAESVEAEKASPISTPTEKKLAAIWADLIGTPVWNCNADFFDSGGDSLASMKMLEIIRSTWGISIDVSSLFAFPSVKVMASFIDKQYGEKLSPVEIDRIEPVKAWDVGRGDHMFAFVGGSGTEAEFTKYHLMGRQLGEDWRIHILPDPDTRLGGFPRTDLKTLTNLYRRSIMSCTSKGKLWLMGDCIGAIDALAVACALQQDGVQNIGLVLLDPIPPPILSEQSGIKAVGLESYHRLPERMGYINESIFNLFLSQAKRDGFSRWLHIPPRSRAQVLRMAVDLKLFDPVDYMRRFPETIGSAEKAFQHYLEKGWLQGEIPSARFNAFRYVKHVPEFHIGEDEPVTHALTIGFRERYRRSRIMRYVKSPNLKSDTTRARREVRMKSTSQFAFKGEVHMILSDGFQDAFAWQAWEGCIDGEIHCHPVKGDHKSYLKEHLKETADQMHRILDGRINTNVR